MSGARLALWVAAFACCPVWAAPELMHYRVNGLPVRIEHARGSDAHRLVAQHLAAQPLGPDKRPAQWSPQGRWTQMASVQGTLSQVLQVRGAGSAMEAIRSTLDLRRAIRPFAASPLWLPPASHVMNTVESVQADPSQQWIARGTWNAGATSAWLRLAARVQGWQVHEQSADTLQLSRGGQHLRVVVLAAGRLRAAGSIVVLTRWGKA